MASIDESPSPRSSPFVVSTKDKIYLWGGRSEVRVDPGKVYIYSVDTETWMPKFTKGFHPPSSLYNGSCALSGQNIYLYGGFGIFPYSGALYRIDTENWSWSELSNCTHGGPVRKGGCRMMTYKDQLIVVGGYYGTNEPDWRQPGSRTEFEFTNELHSYGLTKGSWSSPFTNNSRPSPCAYFSLTRIDDDNALMFGGEVLGSGYSADVRILQLSRMSWSCLPHKDGNPRPEGRDSHIAVCLGYGGHHKSVLISGGWNGKNVLSDTWLLDLQSMLWNKVSIPNQEIVSRYGHRAASLKISDACMEVVLFGGLTAYENLSSVMANTAVLRFELQDNSSNQKSWNLTDIADHIQLGSSKRLADKRRMIESSGPPSEGSTEERIKRLQQQLEEMKIRVQEEQNEAEKFRIGAEEADRMAEEADRRAAEADRRAEEADRRAEEADGRAEESERRAEEYRRRAEDAYRRAGESEERAMQLERELDEVRGQAADSQRRLRECENHLQAYDLQWVVRTEEVELIGPELGRGAWASVTVAKFRGLRVAAKKIHNQIVCRRNIQLFRREMSMAARVRHPNLVQFIGATLEGDMMILMEFMATSLRRQLEREEYFQPRIVKSMSLDVARALNYLHQMQPDPIVHRDISSANVLLEELSRGIWKAKLTDYGSVNLVRQLNTENPGGPAYAAPEANNPCLQSPKMDIYSFGALMLEMLTGQLPVPEDRPTLLCQVQHQQLLQLVGRCLSERIEERPNASAIINELC